MLKQLEEHPLEQVEVQLPSQPPPQEFPQPPLQFWEHLSLQEFPQPPPQEDPQLTVQEVPQPPLQFCAHLPPQDNAQFPVQEDPQLTVQEDPQPPLQFWEHTVVQLPVQLLASQANLQVPLQPELLPIQPQADHHPPLHPP